MRIRPILVLSLTAGLTGCTWFGRKPVVATVPPAPVAKPAVPFTPPPPELMPVLATAIDLPVPPALIFNLPPAPVIRRPVLPRAPRRVAAPAPAVLPPVQAAAPPTELGQILTPQQAAVFRRNYQQSVQATQQALAQITAKSLTTDQTDTTNRIRSFLREAEDAEAKDPSTAAQLAKRAELLARDLAAALR